MEEFFAAVPLFGCDRLLCNPQRTVVEIARRRRRRHGRRCRHFIIQGEGRRESLAVTRRTSRLAGKNGGREEEEEDGRDCVYLPNYVSPNS